MTHARRASLALSTVFRAARRRGKRDWSDIGKIGSFEILVRDPTKRAGRFWWDGISRLESSRGVSAVVRETGGLPSIRAGFARDSRCIADVDVCVRSDAERLDLLLWQ
jgi:hypothetical protein